MQHFITNCLFSLLMNNDLLIIQQLNNRNSQSLKVSYVFHTNNPELIFHIVLLQKKHPTVAIAITHYFKNKKNILMKKKGNKIPSRKETSISVSVGYPYFKLSLQIKTGKNTNLT